MAHDPFQVANSELEQWSSPFEELLQETSSVADDPLGTAQMQQPNPTFGTPDQDSPVFPGQQSYPDTCAIRCQEFLIEQFTGVDNPEDVYVQEAMNNGWYTPGGGTTPQDVGNLLELHGISVNRYDHANIFHLTNELAQGHKVIIGVDSGELWQQHPVLEHLEDALGIQGADHAVVVSGVDTSDPNDVYVIVSDPGTGEAVARYPLEQFLDAWKDSDFFIVATQEAAPSHLPEMAHFDYSLGHIPEVNGMPYEQFLELEDQPEDWEKLVTSIEESLGLDPLHLGAGESHDDGGFTDETHSEEDERFGSEPLHTGAAEHHGDCDPAHNI